MTPWSYYLSTKILLVRGYFNHDLHTQLHRMGLSPSVSIKLAFVRVLFLSAIKSYLRGNTPIFYSMLIRLAASSCASHILSNGQSPEWMWLQVVQSCLWIPAASTSLQRAQNGDGVLNDCDEFFEEYMLRQNPESSPLKTDMMKRINFEITMSFSYLVFLPQTFHICELYVL